MRINSIYRACEGEGVNIGTPLVFVRTQGCSLHCKNCDTIKSWNPCHGTDLSINEIVEEVKSYGLRHVSVTGGNPIEAQEIVQLIYALKLEGFWVNVEATGQDFNQDVFDNVDFISCDIKPPSTCVVANLSNVELMLVKYHYKMQLKMVCADNNDLDFIFNCYDRLCNILASCPFVITPCYTEHDTGFDYSMIDTIYQRVLDSKICIRTIMQQHKVVYGSKREDV